MLGRELRIMHFADGSVFMEGIPGNSRNTYIIAEKGEHMVVSSPPYRSRGRCDSGAMLFVRRIGPWVRLVAGQDVHRECRGAVIMSVDRTEGWLDPKRRVKPPTEPVAIVPRLVQPMGPDDDDDIALRKPRARVGAK